MYHLLCLVVHYLHDHPQNHLNKIKYSRTITPVLNLPTQQQIRVGTKDTVYWSRDIGCRQPTVGRNFDEELPPLTRCSAAMSFQAGSQKRFVLHLYQGGSYCYLEWTNIGIRSLQRLLCLNFHIALMLRSETYCGRRHADMKYVSCYPSLDRPRDHIKL